MLHSFSKLYSFPIILLKLLLSSMTSMLPNLNINSVSSMWSVHSIWPSWRSLLEAFDPLGYQDTIPQFCYHKGRSFSIFFADSFHFSWFLNVEGLQNPPLDLFLFSIYTYSLGDFLSSPKALITPGNSQIPIPSSTFPWAPESVPIW